MSSETLKNANLFRKRDKVQPNEWLRYKASSFCKYSDGMGRVRSS